MTRHVIEENYQIPCKKIYKKDTYNIVTTYTQENVLLTST